MDFQQSVKACLKKYVEFNGRAGRPEFWWFVLAVVIVQFLVSAVLGNMVAMLVNLALLLPQLAAGSRRLHDMGKSGWFQLLGFIPVIGWAVLIYWLAQPSVGPNAYGEGPALPADVALPPPGAA
ncbi:MAG TPA: DUF805 domain-containing protein [Ramlibacter sp.]|uniref:DUF805 domain-containing protein n=1 Tax=Ramlibacter sp. TaxID=1917967 RepID=UPI002ED4B3EF